MAKIDQTYHTLLETIFKEGRKYQDPNRKGVERLQIDDYRFAHNFSDGFPAITTRKTYFKLAVGELLAFLSGGTNVKDLHNKGVNFWWQDGYNHYKKLCEIENWTPYLDFENWKQEVLKKTESAVKHRNCSGDLGKIYPYQMRRWNGNIDQIKNLIETLRTNPMATKKTVTMWNPSDLEYCALSPCHWSFECLVSPLSLYERTDICSMDFFVQPDEETLDALRVPKYSLKIKYHVHSQDVFLGAPTNINYYSVLCYILAELTGMHPKGIVADLSNIHLYDNQYAAAKQQLIRSTEEYKNCRIDFSNDFDLAVSKFKQDNDFDKFINSLKVEDFNLIGYNSFPAIKVEMLSYNK